MKYPFPLSLYTHSHWIELCWLYSSSHCEQQRISQADTSFDVVCMWDNSNYCPAKVLNFTYVVLLVPWQRNSIHVQRRIVLYLKVPML